MACVFFGLCRCFDFDGVFTDNRVLVGQDGSEFVFCDRADGLGIEILRKLVEKKRLHADLLIVSKEKNPVVAERAKKLKLQCFQGVDGKLSFLKEYLSKMFPDNPDPFGNIIYLGNDLNDLEVLKTGCFFVAPADAHPTIASKASVVLDKIGGRGFIREFVEKWTVEAMKSQIGERDLYEFIFNS